MLVQSYVAHHSLGSYLNAATTPISPSQKYPLGETEILTLVWTSGTWTYGNVMSWKNAEIQDKRGWQYAKK